jgi:hypothetical protein
MKLFYTLLVTFVTLTLQKSMAQNERLRKYIPPTEAMHSHEHTNYQKFVSYAIGLRYTATLQE